MSNSRERIASARSNPSLEAGSRLPGAPNPPSTPLRDLFGVHAASQVTPLSGITRKRQKDALLIEKQQTSARSSLRRASASGQHTNTLASDVAAPSKTANNPFSLTPPTSSFQPMVQAPQQLDITAPENQAAAAAAAASSPAPGAAPELTSRAQNTSNLTGTRTAYTTNAPGSTSRNQSRKPKVSERLREYRLLSSSHSNAFDVAVRGGLKDDRVFVRLNDTQHQVDDILSNAGSSSRIATVDVTKTGFALTPTRTSKSTDIMLHAKAIKTSLKADEVDLRRPALIRILSDVPVKASGLTVVDDDPFFLQEIELALYAKLVAPPRRMCKPEDLLSRSTTAVWIAIHLDYSDAARPRRVRLMQAWSNLRLFTNRSNPTPCGQCWSFGHDTDACRWAPRCQQCSAHTHTTEDHTCNICSGKGKDHCVPLCGNCTGPHLPGSSDCKANPTFDSTVNGFIIPAGQRLHKIKKPAYMDRREAIKRLPSVPLDPKP
ncbi:hypothetical protein A4X13_0g6769 [Tilletia indica]|uniref:Uncharacterized protein n=1 Tax=Tilletia indica TaxID=43049 RepID=A0A8T8SMR5_9BASI|nr:hypothetical protein A4X13_0g6769 [Tilletia indica]